MSKKRAVILLVVAVIVGLASLTFAVFEPTTPGPWVTAFGMACLAVALVIQLREMGEQDR